MAGTPIAFTGFEAGQIRDASSQYYELVYNRLGDAAIEGTVVRTGSYSLKVYPGADANQDLAYIGFPGGNGQVTGTNNAGTADCYASFALRVSTRPASDDEEFFGFYNTGTDGLRLRVDSDGHINLYTDAGTLLESGTTALATTTWYEIKFSQLDSDGSYSLYIDGVLEYSGTTTVPSGNLSRVYLGRETSRNNQAYVAYFDDLTVSSGGFIEDNFGVEVLVPNAAGYYTGGSGSYADIDEIPLNALDNIAMSGTNTHSCQCADMTLTGNVAAVKASIMCKRSSIGDSGNVFIRSGTTDLSVVTPMTFLGSYYTVEVVAAVDPNTSAAWAASAVNAAEVGFEATTSGGTGPLWGVGHLHVLVAGETATGAGWKIAYNFGG